MDEHPEKRAICKSHRLIDACDAAMAFGSLIGVHEKASHAHGEFRCVVTVSEEPLREASGTRQDEGNDVFEAPNEEGFWPDPEDYISSNKKGRNMLAKKNSNLTAPAVAEIDVDPADLDPEDIIDMQFVDEFIAENPENLNGLMLADWIISKINLIRRKMRQRAPLVIASSRGIPTSSTIHNLDRNATCVPGSLAAKWASKKRPFLQHGLELLPKTKKNSTCGCMRRHSVSFALHIWVCDEVRHIAVCTSQW